MSKHTNLCWGVDLGGTKIEGIVADPSNIFQPLCRVRLDTESHLGYEHILKRIHELLEEMKRETGAQPRRVGFGTPGVLDPVLGMLKNSNTTCLNGRALKKDLERTLGVEALLSNDANCFALAEALKGAAEGVPLVFGVILGTGVGGGIVLNGEIIGGLQGIAGEWGHNVLIPDGTPCYCGKRGCVETVISGPALERSFAHRSGRAADLKEISDRYLVGDAYAREVLTSLCEQFGRAISVVINILDPHMIVLGGGVSNIELLYTLGIEEAKKHVFNNRLDTKIVRNLLGDSAGVFGATLLCFHPPAP